MTAIAQWLNTFFAGFDQAIFNFAYSLHEGALGGFFDWFFPAITHLGDDGIFFILVAVFLLLFKRTRRCGLTMLIALLVGLLVTNLTIKNIVARPRPYIDEAGIYFHWWNEIGHGLESEFSFPSGHATASFAAMTSFFVLMNKKYSWLALVLATLIGFSRIYIFVHYPSDVLGGVVAGVLASMLALLITKYVFLEINKGKNKAAIFLRDFDLAHKNKKA